MQPSGPELWVCVVTEVAVQEIVVIGCWRRHSSPSRCPDTRCRFLHTIPACDPASPHHDPRSTGSSVVPRYVSVGDLHSRRFPSPPSLIPHTRNDHLPPPEFTSTPGQPQASSRNFTKIP
ncbi:hypothetical protein CGGC5_v017284 [Colletotrichum fructicola Nara gc5]|uniref:C3H1-type domain-containing protein n=1 Tax=Colletotrichum fructicola (strain Nara gc5) TaxID=1213859 RepID=A0A7J6ID84_COLFN|nr:hypothetical protein CGGC5_v017284 [Colletotrichum fructicola Nara gc5]